MSEETSDDARRKVLKGAAVGLAAMASAGHSKAEASPAQGKAAVPLMDPGKLHTAGPFRSQPQPWPGLASHMTPRPDHGEKTYRGSGRMAGRKALITGGDSGLGRATAIAFAREGADVAISYLPQEEEDAREVIQLIQAEGRKAVALPGDIRTEAFCQQLVTDAVSGLGGLDCLVNCAGRQHYHESILDLTTEDFDWTLKTNLYALFWIIKAAIPNLTKSLAKQLVLKGIRINAVAPGPFWTALQVCGGQPMSAVEKFGSTVPMKRPGQPAEIAPIYVQLASTDGSYITGQVFGVTGGTGVPG
ncbi:oxidoreductase/short-chain dehydrogenase/reductase SDR [Gluconobacter frateurii M-2]|nr:oxidoreductase/short-chain dehydrogenase/reductase SDR [Gluconobacter frateurii M-2]